MNRVEEHQKPERDAPDCDETRDGLHQAWSEGKLGETLSSPGATTKDVAALARHIEECLVCRDEAESLVELDRVLSDGFRRFDEATALPDEDRIAAILHSAAIHPDVPFLRRTRRSVKTLLWMGFFFFSLLAFGALGLLAYKVLITE